MTTTVKLKAGDRVRRIAHPIDTVAPLGFETEVTRVSDTGPWSPSVFYRSRDGFEVSTKHPEYFELIRPAGFQLKTLITFEGEPIREMTRERLLEVIEFLGREAYPDIFKEAA